MDIETANKNMTYYPLEGIWRDRHWIKYYLHESCSVCGKPFVGKHYNTRCSRKCFLVDDNPMFKESNKKAMSERYTGEKNHMKRPEVAAKITGENSPFWMGGLSFIPYSSDFNQQRKREIRKRDGYKCSCCGALGGPFDVHHINYDKENASPSNLITLCRPCHSKTNYNRDAWHDKYSRMTAIQT
jgi:HNH endonuclease.